MTEPNFDKCLYFTVSKLNRTITRIAEEEFSRIGLSPTYAFLLMLVNSTPGITPTELSEKLFVTPSTITRFLDKLEGKGLVQRKGAGKRICVHPTEQSLVMQEKLDAAWDSLCPRYFELFGEEMCRELSRVAKEAADKAK
ncbi:MarR family transcriptional regulator [Paenibacillus mucilaginosus 3016]|uniref:MarR family transcriptional regulator n=1 Tax=Paenibacillus mucilaginosus 3016 TaxID=1116391 RepID=H6NE89_9BACL|nr:MarR family transcriptional regulator [Paenibacillus mucilaginosus]AFC33865.1 MarR family transcriptional regulator [Paenibacillus mucilaginosus 3016]WFA22245.1 MarR family transcriptional regulator [Paenibacillus mucilaginosus]